MSSSDSSSSDSDASDYEDIDSMVKQAFNVMKQSLAPPVKCYRPEKKKFTSRHKQIYETFQPSGSAKSSKADDKLSARVDDDKLGSTEFFIDKGHSKEIDDGQVSEQVYEDILGTVTYDLANIDAEDNETKRDKQSSTNDSTAKAKKKQKEIGQLSSRLQTDLDTEDVYVNVDPLHKKSSKKKSDSKSEEPEIMKKCVITDDFEKQDSIATTHNSVRQLKKQRKIEREKTKGGKWFNMPATEITEERKYDLSLVQMRKSLDPKRFYKANDLKTTPKYFQFGEVIADATDFYSSRIPKKQRKSTIVEELLADAEFRKYNKRKYEEVQDVKRQGKGPYKHMKRLKKSKK